MRQYNQEYKNLFSMFKDSYINFKHFSHYIDNMNRAKSGCYFLHNLDMALLNLIIASNAIKHSSKKIENILYYPIKLPKLLTDFNFNDFKNNTNIQSKLKTYNLTSLKNNFNKIIDYLSSNKFSKATLLDNLNQLEKYMWVMYKAFHLYIDEYEQDLKSKDA